MSHINNDIFFEERGQWLEEVGLTEGDVMRDGRGEYIYFEDENGNAKRYLPDDIQNNA